MNVHYGAPFRGEELAKLESFLSEQNLSYDNNIQFSVCLMDESQIAATGSLDANTLKCIAVARAYQNEGLAASIVTELINEAGRRGYYHLFLFTKPENEDLFTGLGFYQLAKTGQVLLMENKKQGISHFVSSLKKPETAAETGAIVANCNPFTAGHLYLIETAASQCDLLYLFIVSEDKSSFPAETRLELVRLGTAHIPNVQVCTTGHYLVSAATFPDYFLKDRQGAVSLKSLSTELDLRIFAECFAGPLGIKRRYVGTESIDEITAFYNRSMKELLPSYGIDVIEIPRLEDSGGIISASRVRRLLGERNHEAVLKLVPQSVYDLLIKNCKIG